MKKFFLLAFGFVLASCAPISFQPGSATNPIETSLLEPASIEQNSEVYVVTSASPWIFSRSQADDALDSLTDRSNPQKGQKYSTSVYWVRALDVDTFPGITVELVNQRATREVTDVGRTTFSIADRLELIFKVKVASTTNLGRALTLVRLVNTSDPTKKGIATLSLNIVKPQIK